MALFAFELHGGSRFWLQVIRCEINKCGLCAVSFIIEQPMQRLAGIISQSTHLLVGRAAEAFSFRA